MFADFQVRIFEKEDNLQNAASKLNLIIKENGLAISVHKTKLMAFNGREPDSNKMPIVKII